MGALPTQSGLLRGWVCRKIGTSSNSRIQMGNGPVPAQDGRTNAPPRNCCWGRSREQVSRTGRSVERLAMRKEADQLACRTAQWKMVTREAEKMNQPKNLRSVLIAGNEGMNLAVPLKEATRNHSVSLIPSSQQKSRLWIAPKFPARGQRHGPQWEKQRKPKQTQGQLSTPVWSYF